MSMQGVSLERAPVWFGRREDPQRRKVIDERLNQYKTGWQQLVQWDKTAHGVPVFQQVDIPKMIGYARTFLERQLQKHPSETMPFLIGMTGGSASGKTTVKKNWLKLFSREAYRQIGWKQKQDGPIVGDIDLDNYYKNFADRRKQIGDKAFFSETNLDHPDALTLNHAARDVMRLKNGTAVRIPKIEYRNSSRREGAIYKAPAPFMVVEGLFALKPVEFRRLFNMRIFVAADAETRKQRWWMRAPERGLKNDAAGNALFNRTMRMHDTHVEPTRNFADVVINGAASLADTQEAMKRLTRLLLKTFTPKDRSA